MRILAIECSSDIASLALLEGDSVLWERSWEGGAPQSRQAWVADIDAWVRNGTIPLRKVDVFAVGVGPGAFSGLRMAISFMHGLVLPVRALLYGVSSGAALAWRAARDLKATRIVVAGDARRNEIWLGRFGCASNYPESEVPWSVVPFDRLPPDYVTSDATWVTADWHRMGARLKALCPPGSRVVEARRVPEARDVGLLAAAGLAAGRASLPLTPLYLHPAVFIPPRDAAVR